jgi:hypothetical protein
MEKIISLFARNYDGDRLVRDEVVPGAEWVQAGEGFATVKIDGTSCMVRDGRLFRRYDAKPGRTPPPGFEQSGEPDPVTGRVQGWVLVGDGPEDRWHREAFDGKGRNLPNGTYELIGPKVQGNAERMTHHFLYRHGEHRLNDAPTDFDGVRAYLADRPLIEGIVWHHPDGRMVKIKRRDFGLPWPVRESRS